MEYLIVVGKAGSNYGADSPDVSVIAVGKTVEKTITSMREALSIYVEEVFTTGNELAEPKTLEQHLAEGNLPDLQPEDLITHVTISMPAMVI